MKATETKGMKNLRHFVVTHSHRHGVTTGVIIAQRAEGKPSPAQAVKLLRLDVDPGREEFVELVEVSPVFLSKPQSNPRTIEDRRARLIAQWATRFYDLTESWNGPLGMQLAYLFAAIARGSYVALAPNSALVRLLRQAVVPSNDPVWQFLRIEK